ncbi:polysaccharide deacetylase family protein [Paramagnetospirillum magnetotacticum MS-1]|uniref:Chitooligosaccharide deacetylase n=1 Tax=Paramagnetospirillum magnetotacticum MS-1 TaxID=272627 RepID=A0A0C2U8J1_PARME|nr:polysaccharide deacetylase family protein [Paramagnetospirillum magnetotacticum]KIL97817.1 polysaccharide deacetylase family protein [Paramagnetospirillum magnetotacticum MS-1]
MSLRDAIAPLALAGWRLVRPVLGEENTFRILLLHDVPTSKRDVFARLVQNLTMARRLITPVEAEAILAGGPVPPGPSPVLLSFDDGFASNLDVAETILAPLGIKALFFVCPGLIGLEPEARAAAATANILRGQRPAPEPLLGWDGIERLAALGHTMGSHTSHHLRLTTLSPDQRAEEIGGAARLLTERLGKIPDWFAYTFGDIDSIDAASLAEIGRHHRYCRSGVRGPNSKATPPLALRGDNIDLGTGEAWRGLAVEGGLDVLYRKQRRILDAMADRS